MGEGVADGVAEDLAVVNTVGAWAHVRAPGKMIVQVRKWG